MTRARPEDGIAWVTGASAGIGRALRRALAVSLAILGLLLVLNGLLG